MTYQPNIPQSFNQISQSQVDLLNNFQQLDVAFSVDHNPIEIATGGEHKQVTLTVPLAADPVIANPVSMFYSKVVSGLAQAFFSNGTSVTQLTGLPQIDSSNGSIYFPGGIVMQWGNIPGTGSTQIPVAFPVAFPTNVFNIQLTAVLGSGDTTAKTFAVKATGITAAGFTIQSSTSSVTSVYWFAIGN